MSGIRRTGTFFTAILMLIFSAIILIDPSDGIYLVLLVLVISLTLMGIRQIIYYFTMARYMVGGKTVFYRGIFALDAGLFMMMSLDDPKIYAILYLIGALAVQGAISVLRGIEAKKLHTKSWEILVFRGVVRILIAGISIFYMNSVEVLVVVFAVGLVYTALAKMKEAFTKTAIIFVQ